MSLENRILKFALPYVTFSIFTATPIYAEPNSNSMYHFMLGNLCKDEGNLEYAIKNYHEALNHDEKSLYLQNIIAETLIQQGKFDLALIYLKNILSKNPNDILALINAGESKYNLDDYNGARKYFEKITSKCNNKSTCMFAYHRLGIINYKEKKFNLAINDLEKSIDLIDKYNSVDRLIAHYNIFFISRSHYFLKEYDKAKECLEALIVGIENEEDPEIKKIFEFVKKGKFMEIIEEAIKKEERKKKENIKTKK